MVKNLVINDQNKMKKHWEKMKKRLDWEKNN